MYPNDPTYQVVSHRWALGTYTWACKFSVQMRFLYAASATPVSHWWRVVPSVHILQIQRANAVLYSPSSICGIPPVATVVFRAGIALLLCHTGLHTQKKVVCTWHYAKPWHDVVGRRAIDLGLLARRFHRRVPQVTPRV